MAVFTASIDLKDKRPNAKLEWRAGPSSNRPVVASLLQVQRVHETDQPAFAWHYDEHNFDPIQARYVKVNMLNNSANPGVHINELMVYEAEK